MLNKATEFLDEHLRIVTKLGYIIAGIGVFSVARRSRLLTKFSSASDIPNHFVEKRIKLRGRVRDVRLDNIIVVEHLPSFGRLNSIVKFGRTEPGVGMPVSLAGVRLNTPGCVSLKNKLHSSIVWFELLSCQRPMVPNPPAVFYVRKMGFLRNLNVEVVKLGLGLAERIADCDGRGLRTLQRNLFRAQKYAAKKNRGIWMD